MSSEIENKQFFFGKILPILLQAMLDAGYTYSLGCAKCELEGHHREKSCHYIRLAIDINLFKDGVWLKDGADHEQFHVLWERLGGAKAIPGDLNHYSVEYRGRR